MLTAAMLRRLFVALAALASTAVVAAQVSLPASASILAAVYR